MIQEQLETVWVVVKVESGIPVTVEAFRDEQVAKKCERFFRAHMRPENDETGLFETQIWEAVPIDCC